MFKNCYSTPIESTGLSILGATEEQLAAYDGLGGGFEIRRQFDNVHYAVRDDDGFHYGLTIEDVLEMINVYSYTEEEWYDHD